MNIIQRIRFLFSNRFEELAHRFLIGEDPVNVPAYGPMSTTTAMKYTAVFACLRVLAETFASVPFLLYRKLEDGDREVRNDLALYDILHYAPNPEMAPFNFKEAIMMALNTGGNAVCERLVARNGELVGLYPYQWQQVTIRRDERQKLVYDITNGLDKKVQKTLERDQVLHIPGLSLDGVIGVSPIEYATSAIRLGKSFEEFGNNLFRNAAVPSGAFSVPGALSDAAYNRLRTEIEKNYTGMRNTGIPLLLEGGTTFTPFTIKPTDAQLIEHKKFQIEDIARIYRVPLHLIQNLDRATNNNIEHQSLEFIMYTMLPWFKRVEENINMQLLTRRERHAGYYVEAKLDGLLRGDTQGRARAYALGRQWGWLSVNDIRRLENLSPIPNGDIYLQPLNMVEAGGKEMEQQLEALTQEIFKMIREGRMVA